MKSLGLYLHIPFCKSRCAYCDFYSLSGRETSMDAYADALCVHLAQCAASGQTQPYSVDSVYFGGGTPSLFGEGRLLRVWDAVTRHYNVTPDAEITLEANPDSVGEWFRRLRDAGWNRASLGMQSADNSELCAIGRIHTIEQVRAAVEQLRAAGFTNLSLDLMYGLPGQTADSWRNSLRAATAMQPEHLSAYGLKVEPGTPLYTRREAAGLPDEEQQADMYLSAVRELERNGYRQYEISNFALPGRESRHNLKYWTLGEYLGFGPGAHSDFGGVRFAYPRDLERYIQGVCSGALEHSEWEAIPEAERARERIMLGLRTSAGVEEKLLPENCASFLRQCQKAGYLRGETGRVSLTPEGFLVSNQIIGVLLEAFDRLEPCASKDFYGQDFIAGV